MKPRFIAIYKRCFVPKRLCELDRCLSWVCKSIAQYSCHEFAAQTKTAVKIYCHNFLLLILGVSSKKYAALALFSYMVDRYINIAEK